MDLKEDNSDETKDNGSRMIGFGFGFEEGRKEVAFGKRDFKVEEPERRRREVEVRRKILGKIRERDFQLGLLAERAFNVRSR